MIHTSRLHSSQLTHALSLNITVVCYGRLLLLWLRMQQEGLVNDEDSFRKMFKYYKQKQPPPDLSGVINFRDELSFEKHVSSLCCIFWWFVTILHSKCILCRESDNILPALLQLIQTMLFMT